MKLDTKGGLDSAAHRVIIGAEGNIPVSVPKDDQKRFDDFLQGKEDVRVLSKLKTSLSLVKRVDDEEKMRVAGAKIRASLPKEARELAVYGKQEDVYSFLEGFLLSAYQFNKYFGNKEERDYKLDHLLVEDGFEEAAMEELLNVTKAVYWTRDMVNEPVSFLNAEQLAEEVNALSNDADITVTTLEKAQIEALKMGGLLAVNKGSIDPPTFTIVEYKSKEAKNSRPIVLVGKGVVYDTGGLSLKPTPNSMDLMKCDMGGAACVAGTIYLAALQQLPLHIIALIPATDNRPGLNAYAPGDVITMFNGKTVEVLNTDAEGRMILADALSYSAKYDPELVIDAATLTGAAVRAVGVHATCIMGNADEAYFEKLTTAGNECYERTVRFPFWDEYGEEMKSPIADLKNLGGPSAGMITAGKFLENFVEAPFIHLDLSAAWMDKQDAYRTRGGSGIGVRLLYNFLKTY